MTTATAGWFGLRGDGVAAIGKAPQNPSNDELDRRYREAIAKAIASIPYRRIETTGADALKTWERLKAEGKGWPIIVGGDEDLARIADQWSIFEDARPKDILTRAARLKYPDDLRALVDKEHKDDAEATREVLAKGDAELPSMTDIGPNGKAHTLTPDEVRKRLAQEPSEPPLGEWPDTVPAGEGLTVAHGLKGEPLDKVHIFILPTMESAAAPAYLKWGGWNACPAPEYHVAALRSWHDRYGAELIGISGDVINIRVRRRPQTREEALALAHEQFLYCEDLILQGTEAFAPLAASLMNDDWWFFWWD
jgi:hypothetical protein